MLIGQCEGPKLRSTLLILSAALLLRLVWFLLVLSRNPAGFFEADSREYWRIAGNLVQNGSYSLSEAAPYLPDHRRTPFYPLFIAAFRVFRLDAAVVVGVQAALSLFAVLGAMELAARLFGDGRPPLWAGMLVAADIPSIVFASSLLTETTFTALFLLGVLLCLEGHSRGKTVYWTAGAVVLGISTLCRPVALFFPAVLAGLYLAADRAPWRRRIGRAAMFLGFFLLTLAPWAARNYFHFGRPFLSTIGDTNMLEYRAAAVYAQSHRVPIGEASRLLRKEAESTFPGSKETDPVGFLRHGAAVGRRVILAHPLIYLANNFRAALSLLFAPLRSTIDLQLGLSRQGSSLQQWGQVGGRGFLARLRESTSGPAMILVMVQILHLLALWTLLALAVFRSIRERELLGVGLVFFIMAYFLIVAGGPEAYARFRIPLIPFLAALARWGSAIRSQLHGLLIKGG